MSKYGRKVILTSYGESHSKSVGGILEGLPGNYKINIKKIQKQLDRRRAKGEISSARQELDKIEIHSGIKETGESLGTPIGFLVKNQDIKPEDYKKSQGIGRIISKTITQITIDEIWNTPSSGEEGQAHAKPYLVIGGAMPNNT